MNTTERVEPLNLDRLKSLFRDESGYTDFVNVMVVSFSNATCPVFAGGKMIGVALSTENAKDLLFDRVVEQWAKEPSVLSRLAESLSDDDLIEADDLND